MNELSKPDTRPANPRFSSGPCAKRPGWSVTVLEDAFLGRSHRHKDGKARLMQVMDRTRSVLEIPDSHLVGIVPASDTGAMEMALWSLLGPRGVDLLNWENFGATWANDVLNQLKLDDVRMLEAPYGELPDLSRVDPGHDVVFTWNGTTSGVRVPDGDWIAEDREGLTICDATSAAFAMDLPWDKLDVTTWSWQKVMGGEGAHGMIVLGPRAVTRLESYTPPWPMPKLFRLVKNGKLDMAPFEAATINTPSMMAVEDAIDSLKWAEAEGGVKGLMARTNANFKATSAWVESAYWVDFLALDPAFRSPTSVCLKVIDPWLQTRGEDFKDSVGKRIAALLEAEGAALDIASYVSAPAGLRIWNGATVETSDLQALFPWLDWAWATIKAETDGGTS
ncbi:MAG: phosphoserine transaminase [Proteobacteria bacterium]|nr:phosphoserine transaminase [Pseudomonadota bacterium]